VQLLLPLVNALAARCVSLSLDFSDNRVLFALELLIARELRLLPHLRTLNVKVSIHENRHHALSWIFPNSERCPLPAALVRDFHKARP